jgi:Ribbon-helix-helix protein, copG family
MKRTQLYLDEEMSRLLTAESRRRGTTVSALVREAVVATYGRRTADEGRAVIHRLAGVWAERDDLGETEEFVRGLRRSVRPERWKPSGRGQVSPRHRRHH